MVHRGNRVSAIGRDELMTIEQVADEIGLSSRTIRTYHSRGLLQPPIRIGRKPHYSAAHVNRLRSVLKLQRRGLPLEAIRALLEPDVVIAERLLPAKLIVEALRAEPSLFMALVSAGVLTTSPDGGLAVRSARAVLAARTMHGGGVPIRQPLHTLASSVVAVLPLADATLSRIDDEIRQHAPDRGLSDGDLLEFVVEVFRLCLLRLVSDHEQ
jgi:hypothetical protein